MQVKALLSFAGTTKTGTLSVNQGDIFVLPDGVDWLQAGFVAAIASSVPSGAEHAVDHSALTAEHRSLALDAIDGIGPRTANKLQEVGIITIADLLSAEPNDLAQKLNIAESAVLKWIQRARAIE